MLHELNQMMCSNCGKKLAEIKIKDGVVSIKCNKCGVINIHSTQSTKSAKE